MKRGYIFLTLLVIATITVTLYISAFGKTGETQPVKTEAALYKTISPGDDIQQALDTLPDGGTLTFGEGEYDTLAAIVLEGRKNLTLEGSGEVWINTKGIDHHVITLKNCESITLSNLKAQHVILEQGDNDPIEDGRDGAVIGVIEGSRINLINCELVGCGIYGVYAHASTPLLLDRCYLHDNAKSAVLLTTDSQPVEAVLRDCIITKNTDSIEVRGDIDVKMEGKNRIEQNSPTDYKGRLAPTPSR